MMQNDNNKNAIPLSGLKRRQQRARRYTCINSSIKQTNKKIPHISVNLRKWILLWFTKCNDYSHFKGEEKEKTKEMDRLPWWLSGKESACSCRRCRFDAWVGKIVWRREWQPLSSILGWGRVKELDAAEQLNKTNNKEVDTCPRHYSNTNVGAGIKPDSSPHCTEPERQEFEYGQKIGDWL